LLPAYGSTYQRTTTSTSPLTPLYTSSISSNDSHSRNGTPKYCDTLNHLLYLQHSVDPSVAVTVLAVLVAVFADCFVMLVLLSVN